MVRTTEFHLIPACVNRCQGAGAHEDLLFPGFVRPGPQPQTPLALQSDPRKAAG